MLVAGAVLVGPGQPRAQSVRGFVSTGLLLSWCRSAQAMNTEACLSYLRGVFDSLHAIEARAKERDGDGDSVACISPLVPITQLKLVALRFARANPDALHGQAAEFLLRAFAKGFPCAR